MNRRIVLKTLLGTLAALSAPAWAQSASLSDQPIRMVVPYPPGGVTDIAGRLAGEVLTAHYGNSVVVENRPGANGLIGLQALARAKGDGHTLATGGLGSNVIPAATIQGLPLDLMTAVTPVAQVAEFVNVLVVSADSPIKTVEDLIERAKENSLRYGTNGIGTSSHLTTELFALRVGEDAEFVHVPYKGGGEMLVDVANGNLEFCFINLPPALPMLQGERLRALAVTSSYRSSQLPDVMTMQEAGVDDFEVTSWLGVYAPASISAELADEMGQVIADGLSTPDNTERLRAAGFEPRPGNAKAFADVNASEFERWRDIAEQANVSITFGG